MNFKKFIYKCGELLAVLLGIMISSSILASVGLKKYGFFDVQPELAKWLIVGITTVGTVVLMLALYRKTGQFLNKKH